MTTDQLRNVWKAEPFRPFIIHLADGRQVEVRHSEFLSRSPSGRSIIVYQADESFNVIDLLLVTDLVTVYRSRMILPGARFRHNV